jgi:uncharacterized protein YuzE
MNSFCFQVAVSTDDGTGEVFAVYFRVRKGRVHRTLEYADGSVFADYDRKGQLLGIELLGPCKVSIVDKLAPKEPAEIRKRTKQFMKQAGPPAMVAA